MMRSTALAAVDARKCKVIELRFFGGLSVEETARALNVSVGTIGREQRLAEAWLHRELSPRRRMTPERWQEIGDLFDQALAVPADERSAIDRPGCGDRRRGATRGAVAPREPSRRPRRVRSETHPGRARVVPSHEQWLARRRGSVRTDWCESLAAAAWAPSFSRNETTKQYHAKVAVKLVRPGMDTEFILARFRRERQTLARLQHPNISRLLDGGTTDDGLPYIVMEYIDGPWITAYAAQHAARVSRPACGCFWRSVRRSIMRIATSSFIAT